MSPMRAAGSPSTRMKSASLPGAIEPRCRSRVMIRPRPGPGGERPSEAGGRGVEVDRPARGQGEEVAHRGGAKVEVRRVLGHGGEALRRAGIDAGEEIEEQEVDMLDLAEAGRDRLFGD